MLLVNWPKEGATTGQLPSNSSIVICCPMTIFCKNPISNALCDLCLLVGAFYVIVFLFLPPVLNSHLTVMVMRARLLVEKAEFSGMMGPKISLEILAHSWQRSAGTSFGLKKAQQLTTLYMFYSLISRLCSMLQCFLLLTGFVTLFKWRDINFHFCFEVGQMIFLMTIHV